MEDDESIVPQEGARSIDQERCTDQRKVKFGPTCLPRGACKMSAFVGDNNSDSLCHVNVQFLEFCLIRLGDQASSCAVVARQRR